MTLVIGNTFTTPHLKSERFAPLALQLLTCPAKDLPAHAEDHVVDMEDIDDTIAIFRERQQLDQTGLLKRAEEDFALKIRGRIVDLIRDRTSVRGRFKSGHLKTNVLKISKLYSACKKPNLSAEQHEVVLKEIESVREKIVQKIDFVIRSVLIPPRSPNSNDHPFLPRNLQFDIYESGVDAEKPIITEVLSMFYLRGASPTALKQFDLSRAKKQKMALDRLNFSVDYIVDNLM